MCHVNEHFFAHTHSDECVPQPGKFPKIKSFGSWKIAIVQKRRQKYRSPWEAQVAVRGCASIPALRKIA